MKDLTLTIAILIQLLLSGCYKSSLTQSPRTPANELGLTNSASQSSEQVDRNISIHNRESYEMCVEAVLANGKVRKITIQPNSDMRISPNISFVRVSTLNERTNTSDYTVYRYGNLRQSSSVFFNRDSQKWEFGTPQFGVNPNSKPFGHRPHRTHSSVSVPSGAQINQYPCNSI